MKQALLIVRNFPPVRNSGTIRTESFAKHLTQFGYQPVVLTNPIPPDMTDSTDRVISENQRIESPWRLPRNWFRRRLGTLPVGYTFERGSMRREVADLALKACVQRGLHPDVILSSCPPGDAHVIGSRIASHFNCPHVLDYRDPWSFAPRPAYPHWFDFRNETQQERATLQASTAITVTTNSSAHILKHEFGVPAEKIHLLPNGYEPSEFQDAQTFEPIAADPGRFHIVYTGDIGSSQPESLWNRMAHSLGFKYDPLETLFTSRSPRWFLEGLERWIVESPTRAESVRVWFIGCEALKNDPSVTHFRFPEVIRIVPRVASQVAIGAVLQASLLLLLQIETFLRGQPLCTAIPGKLYSYLASGRRILAAVQPSENTELVHQFQAGVCVSPRSASEFAIAIGEEFDRWKCGETRSPTPRSIPEFERPQQTARLAAIFDSLCAKPS